MLVIRITIVKYLTSQTFSFLANAKIQIDKQKGIIDKLQCCQIRFPINKRYYRYRQRLALKYIVVNGPCYVKVNKRNISNFKFSTSGFFSKFVKNSYYFLVKTILSVTEAVFCALPFNYSYLLALTTLEFTELVIQSKFDTLSSSPYPEVNITIKLSKCLILSVTLRNLSLY